jgi:hypothetical protein
MALPPVALPNLTSSQRVIRLSDDVKERALRWVQAQSTTAHRSASDAPFRRLIDFWFAAAAWLFATELRPIDKAQGQKYVSIGRTPQDVRLQPWRTNLTCLLAIHEFGHEDPRAQDPSAIVDLTNRLAEAGAEPFLAQLDAARDFAVPILYRVTDLFLDEFSHATAGKAKVD